MTDQPNAYRQLEESREDLSVRQRRRRVSGGGLLFMVLVLPLAPFGLVIIGLVIIGFVIWLFVEQTTISV